MVFASFLSFQVGGGKTKIARKAKQRRATGFQGNLAGWGVYKLRRCFFDPSAPIWDHDEVKWTPDYGTDAFVWVATATMVDGRSENVGH